MVDGRQHLFVSDSESAFGEGAQRIGRHAVAPCASIIRFKFTGHLRFRTKLSASPQRWFGSPNKLKLDWFARSVKPLAR